MFLNTDVEYVESLLNGLNTWSVMERVQIQTLDNILIPSVCRKSLLISKIRQKRKTSNPTILSLPLFKDQFSSTQNLLTVRQGTTEKHFLLFLAINIITTRLKRSMESLVCEHVFTLIKMSKIPLLNSLSTNLPEVMSVN